uniref:Uncharacterized protein n=1 Tax=Anguilla anguilla TaxID=7936 RepID=A0A0E9V8C2_ANGAN
MLASISSINCLWSSWQIHWSTLAKFCQSGHSKGTDTILAPH